MPEPGHISQQDPYLITLSADLDGNGKTDTFTGTRQQLLDERNQVQALLDASKGQLQVTTDYLHDQRVGLWATFGVYFATVVSVSSVFAAELIGKGGKGSHLAEKAVELSKDIYDSVIWIGDITSDDVSTYEKINKTIDYSLKVGDHLFQVFESIGGLDIPLAFKETALKTADALKSLETDWASFQSSIQTGLITEQQLLTKDANLQSAIDAIDSALLKFPNHDPEFISGVVSGTVHQATDFETTHVSTSGSFVVADVDHDSLSAPSLSFDGVLLGTFTYSLANNTSDDGLGSVDWSYSIDNSAIRYLAEGQTITEQVNMGLSDPFGGQLQQPITITIIGANDPAVFNPQGSISEGAVRADSNLTASGMINFNDPDLTDQYTIEVVGIGDTYGQILAPTYTRVLDAGLVNWTYQIDPSVITALSQDTNDSFLITVHDGHGGDFTQQVNVAIDVGDGTGTGGGGGSPPSPEIPPGHIVTMDVFTDPVLHDFNGDGAVETPIYVHNAEYYTFDVTNAFSGQYQWVYGGPTDDFDLIVYGLTETFEDFSFPAWEIEAYLESPRFGATRLQTATDAYSIANQDSDPPVRGANFDFVVAHYAYHFDGNTLIHDPTTYEDLNYYTDVVQIPSPFVLQTTTITNGSQTFTYTSETLNWGNTTWPSILPEGGIAVPTSADVVALF